MEAQRRRKFRIIKTFTPRRKQTVIVAMNYLLFFCYIVVSFKIMEDSTNTVLLSGDEAAELTYRLKEWDKPTSPFPSSWRERERFMNSSERKMPTRIDPLLFGTVLTYINWSGLFQIILSLVDFIIRFCITCMYFIVRKFGWRRLIMFLCTCVFLSLLTIVGTWELLLNCVLLIQGNIIKWLEGNIYHVSEQMELRNLSDYVTKHPLTNGREAPFLFYEYYRYNKEDVVFECEYAVSSFQDAKPIYETTWWRKNGVQVIPNDRIYINVSITALNHTKSTNSPLMKYSVFTTLTILLIEDSDYGSYTCDFYNPMKVLVRPGFRMYERFNEPRHQRTEPSSNPACQCQRPPPPKPLKEQCDHAQTFHLDFTYEAHRDCFAEFALTQRLQKTIAVALNPGSILIESARYHTLADTSDIEFDVTAFIEKDHTCCSKFVILYWLLTRYKSFSHFPDSRIIQVEDYSFSFVRVQCLCKSSFGTREFVIHRNHFNSSHGIRDQVQVVFPVKLKLTPSLSHPFNQSSISADTSTECWDSETPPSNCYFIEHALDVFFYYEEHSFYFLFPAVLVIIFLASILVHKCIVSFAYATLYMGMKDETFPAVTGTSPKRLKPAECIENDVNNVANDNSNDNPYYDFYISYDEEEEYDLMVAQHLKGLLLSMKQSVFDVRSDIDPGRCQVHEMSKAIERSHRFVIIVSEAYQDSLEKLLEFNAVQEHIASQGNKPGDRMIIVFTEHCEIRGCKRVPCIRISQIMKTLDALDEATLREFTKWETLTRPTTGKMCQQEIGLQYQKPVSSFSKVSVSSYIVFLVLTFFTTKRFLPLWFMNSITTSYWSWMAYIESMSVYEK